MDWADLLAYAVYDFEDFVRSGDIPMNRLRADISERKWLLEQIFDRRRVRAVDQPLYARVLDRLLAGAPRQEGDPRWFRNALRCFANHLVDEALTGVSLRSDKAGIEIVTELEQHAMIMLTEGLTWHYVIDSAMIAPIRTEQRQIIRELFLALASSSCDFERPAGGALPELRPAQHHDAAPLRLVADTIASMSEREALQNYAQLGYDRVHRSRHDDVP
jgi:dGTP triphosphohydrolase